VTGGDTGALRPTLCWGTVEGAPIPELVTIAATTGYGAVTVTPAMYFEALAAGHTDADLRALLDEHGIEVAVVDPLLAALPGCPAPESVAPRFRATFEHDEADAVRVALALGAPRINVAHYMGAPTPVDTLAEAVAGVARRVAEHDLAVSIEFMPEGSLTDLATALWIVQATGEPNVGILLDTWHFFRTGGRPEDVAALPPGTITALQVSDARADLFAVGTDARVRDRVLPGEGAIPLVEILGAVFAAHPVRDVGVEIFDQQRTDRAEMAAATRAALGRVLHEVAAGPAT
jgi:sugar phosphate isomerase/epimerase